MMLKAKGSMPREQCSNYC